MVSSADKLPSRFFCPTMQTVGTIRLPESESHHLAHVVRMKEGDAIELFDGRGGVGTSVIKSIRKRDVDCEVSEVFHEQQTFPQVVIATAVPKSDRFDWLVEKLTELGVAQLIPLRTVRSTVDPRETKLDRLRQTIISACKQSRRSWLMELTGMISWPEFLEQVRGKPFFVAEGRGTPLDSLENRKKISQGSAFIACIGPEGGWTSEELDQAIAAGGQLVGLGDHWLRIETAGLAVAAWGLLQQNVDRSN